MSQQCPKCQSNNPANNVFCAECGTDLRVASPQAQNAGPAQTPNNVPGPAQPTYVYSNNQPQPPNNVTGPAQPTYVYGSNQPQPPQNNIPTPVQPPPSNISGPAQPTYVYGSNQTPPNNAPAPKPQNIAGPGQQTYVYSGPAQAQSNAPQPSNNPYAPAPNPYAQPNNLYAPPKIGYESAPPPNQIGTYPPQLSTQTGKTSPAVVIAIVAVVIVVIIIGLLNQPSNNHGTPTPDNQSSLVSPGSTGSARSTSTTDLLNPFGNPTGVPKTEPPTNTARAAPTRPLIPTATPQPNFTPVKGPENFQLALAGGKPSIKGFDPQLNLTDCWAEATFINPYVPSNQVGWDYGFVFRNSNAGAYIVTVSSASRWALTRWESTTNQYIPISNGPLNNLKLNVGDANLVDIVVQGNVAFLSVNGVALNGALNVSDVTASGDVDLVTGFFTTDEPANETTNVQNFVVAVKNS